MVNKPISLVSNANSLNESPRRPYNSNSKVAIGEALFRFQISYFLLTDFMKRRLCIQVFFQRHGDLDKSRYKFPLLGINGRNT